MGRQIELLPFLTDIVRTNTHAYQSDFDYDIRTLTRAVQEPNIENRTFYWMSRPSGTWCVRERDVFLRETDGHPLPVRRTAGDSAAGGGAVIASTEFVTHTPLVRGIPPETPAFFSQVGTEYRPRNQSQVGTDNIQS